MPPTRGGITMEVPLACMVDAFYAQPRRDGGIKRWCCLTWRLTVWRLSVAYVGPKTRTERLRKTKIGTEVAYVRHTWLGHHFQGQTVKVQGHQAALLTAALTPEAGAAVTVGTYWAWKTSLLLRCICSAEREALGRPRGRKERGWGISCRHAHSLLTLGTAFPSVSPRNNSCKRSFGQSAAVRSGDRSDKAKFRPLFYVFQLGYHHWLYCLCGLLGSENRADSSAWPDFVKSD